MGKLLAAALVTLWLVGCADTRHSQASTANESARPVAKTAGGDVDIPLDQVPENVRKAAEAAIPGATFTSAEKEVENGTTVYSISGTVGGKECEVEVTADGKVTEMEQEDDGEDDDDDGDDD